jgi:hypothetical protein
MDRSRANKTTGAEGFQTKSSRAHRVTNNRWFLESSRRSNISQYRFFSLLPDRWYAALTCMEPVLPAPCVEQNCKNYKSNRRSHPVLFINTKKHSQALP